MSAEEYTKGLSWGLEQGETRVCRAVWEVLQEVFDEVKSHHGDGTYTAESALQFLWNEMEERLAYGPNDV